MASEGSKEKPGQGCPAEQRSGWPVRLWVGRGRTACLDVVWALEPRHEGLGPGLRLLLGFQSGHFPLLGSLSVVWVELFWGMKWDGDAM